MKRFSILLLLFTCVAQAQIKVTMKKQGSSEVYNTVTVNGLTLICTKKDSRLKQRIHKRQVQFVEMAKPNEVKQIEAAFYKGDHPTVVKLATPFIAKYKYLGWGKAVVPYLIDSLIATKAESKEITYQATAAVSYIGRSARDDANEKILLKIAKCKAKSISEGYMTAIEALNEVELTSKTVASNYYIALGDLYLGQGKKQQAAVQYVKVLVVGKRVKSPQWNLAYNKAKTLYKEINPAKEKQLENLLKIKLAE